MLQNIAGAVRRARARVLNPVTVIDVVQQSAIEGLGERM